MRTCGSQKTTLGVMPQEVSVLVFIITIVVVYVYGYVPPTRLSAHAWYLQRSEEGIGSPGTKVTLWFAVCCHTAAGTPT